MKHPRWWYTGYISMKLQHYVYPQRNSGDRLHQRILILNTLRILYLVLRKQLLTPNSVQKVNLEFYNGLILYYYTPCTARVRQLSLRVVPVNFILVVM